MSKSRIKPEQYVEITEWLKRNQNHIEKAEFTQFEVTTLVSSELHYEVSLRTVVRMAKYVGVTWAKSPPKPPPVPIDHEAIVVLIGALEGLYVETGRSVPDDLADLHSRYVREGDTRT